MSNDPYILTRGEGESSRLNKQGLIFEAALDYQIHPCIQAKLPPNPTVADIGTGTGDYVIRLSKSYPTGSSFYGFDVSDQQFQAGSLPNVKFQVHDVRKAFPTEYHGNFDFVHLRMITAGMEKDDWAIATRNIAQILRPGGALQWEEGDIVNAKTLRGGKPNTTNKNLSMVRNAFFDLNGNRFSYGPRELAGIFKDAGLVAVDVDIVSTDRLPEHRKSITYCSADAMALWAKVASRKGIDPYPGKELETVVKHAYEELEAGSYYQYDIYSTIGFKPE